MSCFGACYVISHDMIHIEWSFQNLQKHLICETAVLGCGHFRVLCPVFSTWHTCHVVRHGHFTLKQLKCIQIHIQVLELTTLGKLISIMTDNAIYHFNFLSLCDQSNELHKFCFVVFLWSLLYFHEVSAPNFEISPGKCEMEKNSFSGDYLHRKISQFLDFENYKVTKRQTIVYEKKWCLFFLLKNMV